MNCGNCALPALIGLNVVAAVTAQEPTPQPSDKLGEGWRNEIKVSDRGDLCVAWVEKGWLQVRRENAAGDLDWQIVLAKATDPTPPVIDTWNLAGSINVSYQAGRYFIRDFQFYLRAFRQKKAADSEDWPRLSLSKDDYQSLGYAQGGGHWVNTWQGKSWFVLTVGPARDAADCIVRMNHVELRDAG